jgi:asparagine synthase (glutamine-hydrolysing)
MCGIAGIQFKHDVPRSVLERAAEHFAGSLKHRGPDAFGAHFTARAVYTNLRLAIVDRSGGNQPIYAPDAARGIVYNGEVYNWQALRTTLQAQYPFTTHADTEVVLATVLAQGDAGLASLNGMFGLCIWDDRDGSFMLARDRFGAKPIYVYEDHSCIAFASELRTLLGLEGLDHSLDEVGFQDYLSYRYNLAPHTLFARIRKLPAGCRLRFAQGRSEIARFADVSLHEPAQARPEADYVAELDHLLGNAVKSQLMGEVPIGLLLSGGLDSSAIAAYVQRAGARLTAYSIGFPEVNEFQFSRDVARKFDLDYVEVTLTQDDLRAGMDEVLHQLDEPIADPACFALSRLCRRIRDDVVVVLSGEGGDEMFAGYGHHTLALDPALSREQAFAHFFHQSANHLDANQWLRNKALPPQQHLRFRPHYDRADTVLNGMQGFELHTWMPENLMMKADKVLMAHSLEGRFPFLDLDVYRFASTLPQSMKLPHAGSSKHVLRRLMADQLPRSVIERRKMGFTVPPAFFLQPLQARLLDSIAALRGKPVAEVLDLDAIDALVRAFYLGAPTPVFKIWNIAVLLLWWADVYPKVRASAVGGARRVPAADVIPANAVPVIPPPRQRLVIYTALIGPKEQLGNPLADLPAGASSDLELDFVCLTDNPQLRSDVWRMQLLPTRHVPPEKLSRRPKALPHEYLPDAQHSLYIDNTVSFKRLPQAADLATTRPYLFRAFRHATRVNPQQEATAIAALGYDDVSVICNQLDFYATHRPLESITPLTTATVLLRSHHDASVKRFGVTWWESILAFSKRDQLSFDFALLESGCEVEYFDGFTHANDFIEWRGSVSPQRIKASFDAKRYAWRNRSDALARQDPKAHFLAHGGGNDQPYLKPAPLLEFLCHAQGSSLGSLVSPRRCMADALEALLAPHRREGVPYLLARAQGGADPQAFSGAELEAAAAALSAFLSPAKGTLIDLPAADLNPDGKVYTTAQTPYDLVIVLGASSVQLVSAVQKLQRLMHPEQGSFVAALTTPALLSGAAAAEEWLRAQFGANAQTALHGSRHDDLMRSLPNTVIGIEWQHATQPQQQVPA